MTLDRVASAIALTLLVACASTSPTRSGDARSESLSGARVEITAEGGIAAMSVTHRVDHDTRTFAYRQGRLCGSGCPAASDSASGTLLPTTTDSLFNVVVAEARGLTKDDYGVTRNGADMMAYTIRITADGRERTIRADDGTLPEAGRQIVAAVRQTISAARRR